MPESLIPAFIFSKRYYLMLNDKHKVIKTNSSEGDRS